MRAASLVALFIGGRLGGLPVGTTSLEDAGPEGEGGPAHFTEGMVQSFEVG